MANSTFSLETSEEGVHFIQVRALDHINAGDPITVRYTATVNNMTIRSAHLKHVLNDTTCHCKACIGNLAVTNNIKSIMSDYNMCLWCGNKIQTAPTIIHKKASMMMNNSSKLWHCSDACKMLCLKMPNFVEPSNADASMSHLPAQAHTDKQLQAQLFYMETQGYLNPSFQRFILPALKVRGAYIASIE